MSDRLDKTYLKRYNLSLDIFDRFDFHVRDVCPIRSVFMISTDKGEKIFKKLDYSLEELKFIDNMISYLNKNFNRTMKFARCRDGNIYTMYKGEVYCIIDLIRGRECDFDNPIDLKIASKGIANFHKASVGFKCDIDKRDNRGKLIDKFEVKKEEMEFFKNIANIHETKNEFDNIFLKEVDYYIDQINESINLLKNSNYYKLSKERNKNVICHHDLAHHNILIKDEEAYFIDFDYSILDLKSHDLCNFISKAIKNSAFDIEKTENILNSYSKENTIDKEELKVLYAILTFPEDFYSISKNYYTKCKDWDERAFLNKLIKKCGYKEDRKEFLKYFKDNII